MEETRASENHQLSPHDYWRQQVFAVMENIESPHEQLGTDLQLTFDYPFFQKTGKEVEICRWLNNINTREAGEY